ncbi:MAG: glucose-6-phosphate dehydrogenase [Thermoanaerobacteraceae bacterium]|nr:glucose-6-phosphate dehydrogenase [Thermoanaerobacteraceae bacterium]
MDNLIMVIFGGTGDLTHRKLMPALYNLQLEGSLPKRFAVVSVARREKTDEVYRGEIYESVKRYSRNRVDGENFKQLASRIHYYRLSFDYADGYIELKRYLEDMDGRHGTDGNILFYLAVSPENFEVVTTNLNASGLASSSTSWRRVMIEKPFGEDLTSAEYLNKCITTVFGEDNIYRIDHYLGKEMLQNMLAIRFANSLFEPLWNNRFIDNVQIISSETKGVENRGSYYEKAGALKDMMQNHMMQLLTLTAMEPPVDLSANSIRDEKLKVLKAIRPFTEDDIRRNCVRGQYGPGRIADKPVVGYREEEKVSPDSNTETFAALKFYIENYRWAGVPFYIRTGKRLNNDFTQIVIEFKFLPGIPYFKNNAEVSPNLLVIKVQPEEGTYLQFNAKRPGTRNTIQPVKMDFCQNCEVGVNSPEAYERLIYDAMIGDQTLFTRWDEVEYSWRLIDPISRLWRSEKADFPNYASGSNGPSEADLLIRKDGREWRSI